MAEIAKKRGRPVGSTKKNILGNGVYTMNFEKQIQNAPINKLNAMGWVNYGSKNLYPFDLINLYNTSVTHKACCDFATNAIVGDGLDVEAMKINSEELQNPNYNMGWNEFIRTLAFDFNLYSAFAFQIIRNRDGKTYSFYHQPVETIRLEMADEDGVINNAYLCKDWSEIGKNPPIKIPMFGFQDEKEIPSGVPYLFYHRQYNPVNFYYGLPVYASALNCIMAEAQYQIFDLKNIVNGFTPVGCLTLQNVETDEERQAIINNISKLFTGAENSNSLLVQFRNNVDDPGVVFTPFTQKSQSADLYEKANERTITRIMAAWKIPSKALIGYNADDTGFSNSGEYMESAFALYNVNVANNNRKEIIDVINQLFKMNGIDVEIILKPLKYRINDDVQTDANTEAIGETTTENEVEERKDNSI